MLPEADRLRRLGGSFPEANHRFRDDRFSRSTPEPEPSSRHLHAGHHLGSKQVAPRLLPRHGASSVLMSSNVSTRRQWFTRVRLLGSYLAALVVRLSVTLTTPALDRRSLRRFGVSPCRATPEGQPPSLDATSFSSVRSLPRYHLLLFVTHAPCPFFGVFWHSRGSVHHGCRPGSDGQRPPRASSDRAISAGAERKPNARRAISRTFVLSDSTRPLLTP